ncbi:MAG TPA: DUF418 domain-containing protein, partial [Flavisolibacter sp.]|nr:DUF418 domain-containing protein [Flavisolibacter sp.]
KSGNLHQATPTGQGERITILDSLRGFAILGILLVNITIFAIPLNDPFVRGDQGINFYTWYTVGLVIDGTQRALFSMLFGAGIILFVRSAEKKTPGLKAADYFFRRQLWLIVFSLIDVFILLWYGDILLDYALFGMLLFTFRNLPSKGLFIAAGICLILMTARENRDFYKSKSVISRGEAVAAIDTSNTKLIPKQKEQLSAMKDFKLRSTPEKRKERMERNLRMTANSDFEDLYELRTGRYVDERVRWLFFEPWDVLLFMFLGMAFFKTGLLTGEAPVKIYWAMFLGGLGLGLLLNYLRLSDYVRYQNNLYEYTKHVSFQYYQLSRALRSIGVFGAIMLLHKSGLFNWLFSLLRPVGQMAFTNYLMQSIICGLFFYSIGFGMYGRLERTEIYYVVAAVWVIQIIFSHIWMRYYRFGPFEWAWRSLTYWKIQPMKKRNTER